LKSYPSVNAGSIVALFGFVLLYQIKSVSDKRDLNPLLEKTAMLLGVYGVASALSIAFLL
jgi:hypothetical protein